jgi:hypothetical protein
MKNNTYEEEEAQLHAFFKSRYHIEVAGHLRHFSAEDGDDGTQWRAAASLATGLQLPEIEPRTLGRPKATNHRFPLW